MKAIVMTHLGGPEVLELRDVPEPRILSSNEILIKIMAAGVNPIDTKLRKSGTYYPDLLPTILGCDGAGIVVEIGSEVRRFKVGDEVYFCNGGIGGHQGNYAEYTTIDEKFAALKPKTLSFVEAAGGPLVLITAWESLCDRINLEERKSVIIHAGAGGVGHVALQLAKIKDAVIFTTVSSEEKAEFVKKFGAEKIINYRENDFVNEIMNWTNGIGVDAGFDTVGGEIFYKTFLAVRFYGDVVTLLEPLVGNFSWKEARRRNLRIGYELMLSPMFFGLKKEQERQAEILEKCSKLIDEGKLIIQVSKTFPLKDVAYAHQLIEKGSTVGKIVLVIEE